MNTAARCADCCHWWQIDNGYAPTPPRRKEFAPALVRLGICDRIDAPVSRYGRCDEWEQTPKEK